VALAGRVRKPFSQVNKKIRNKYLVRRGKCRICLQSSANMSKDRDLTVPPLIWSRFRIAKRPE
jgi:hypothetical protein